MVWAPIARRAAVNTIIFKELIYLQKYILYPFLSIKRPKNGQKIAVNT